MARWTTVTYQPGLKGRVVSDSQLPQRIGCDLNARLSDQITIGRLAARPTWIDAPLVL